MRVAIQTMRDVFFSKYKYWKTQMQPYSFPRAQTYPPTTTIAHSVNDSLLDDSSQEESSLVADYDYGDSIISSVNDWYSNMFMFRRYLDLSAGILGILLCTAHLVLLLYLKVIRNGRSYELMIAHAIISIMALILLTAGCVLDIYLSELSPAALYFRVHLWLFLVNSLMAMYSNLVVVLCLDRYVAMHNPFYYRTNFARKRMRFGLITGCVVLGFIVCLHWLVVNEVAGEGGGIDENKKVIAMWEYKVVRTISYLFKYLVPGVCMSVITYANIRFLSQSCRAYGSEEDGCRIARQDSCDHLVNVHTTIARISAFLTVTFLVFNWPYAIIDYFYSDELSQQKWYGVLTIVVNLLQIVYIQLNLLLFSLCSGIYRRALLGIIMKPATLLCGARQWMDGWLSLRRWSRDEKGHRPSHISDKEDRDSTQSSQSSTSDNTVFTVC